MRLSLAFLVFSLLIGAAFGGALAGELTSGKTAIGPMSRVKVSNPFLVPHYEEFKAKYRLLSEAVKKSPTSAAPYMERGRFLMSLRLYGEAADDFEEASVYAAGDVQPSLWEGFCLKSLGDIEGALWLSHRALMDDEKCAAAHRLKALCLSKTDSIRARREIERAIALEPKNVSFQVTRARIACDRMDFKGALAAADAAIAIDAGYPPCYAVKAEALRGLKLYKEAMIASNKIIQLLPYSDLGYSSRASAYDGLLQEEQADKDEETARQCRLSESEFVDEESTAR